MTQPWPSVNDPLAGDDASSLRAALSVIDDWDFDFGSLFEADATRTITKSETPVRQQPHSDAPSRPGLSKSGSGFRSAPYTGRNRRKLEIQALREESEALEQQLQKAKRVVETNAASPTEQSIESTQRTAAWEQFAKRQQSQRQELQQENDQLRESIASHAKIARQLVNTSRRVRVPSGLLPVTPFEAVDYQWTAFPAAEHLAQLDTMYTQITSVFGKPCFTTGQREFRKFNVEGDKTSGFVVESDIALVLPFDVALVAEALWHHTTRMSSSERVYQIKDIDTQPSSLVSLFAEVSKASWLDICMHGQIATRRYVSNATHEIVSKVLADALTQASDIKFTVRGEGWVRCTPIHRGVSRTFADGVTSSLTQVHWHRRIYVNWSSKSATAAELLLTPDAVANRAREMAEWNLQAVENRLLVQSRRKVVGCLRAGDVDGKSTSFRDGKVL